MTDSKKFEDSDAVLPFEPEFTPEMVECHKQKLELEKQKDSHQYAFAIKNTELLFKDRKDCRTAGIITLSLIVFSILLFSMYALHNGKETVILELLKMLGAAFGGAGIGYAIGVRKSPQANSQD